MSKMNKSMNRSESRSRSRSVSKREDSEENSRVIHDGAIASSQFFHHRRSHPSRSRSRSRSRHRPNRSRSRSRSTSRMERRMYRNRESDSRGDPRTLEYHASSQMRSRRSRSRSSYGHDRHIRRGDRSYSRDRYRRGYEYEYSRPPPHDDTISPSHANYGPPDGYSPSRHRRSEGRSQGGVSLLVRNISTDVTVSDLRGAFSKIGPLRDVYIPMDYHSHKPKGFAFIEYVRPDDARMAQEEMNHFVIKGKRMEVVFAQERRKTPGEMKYKVESTSNHKTRGRKDDRGRSGSYERYHSDRHSIGRR